MTSILSDTLKGRWVSASLGQNGREEWIFDLIEEKGKWCFAPVHEILPEHLNKAFVEGMEQFGAMIRGFDHDLVLVEGVESRTSSPIKILRDENMESVIKGLYPCGEGAGYAGGITSAAVDGIKVFEAITSIYRS